MIIRVIRSLDPDDRVPRWTGATGRGPCRFYNCIIARQIIQDAHRKDVSLAEWRIFELDSRLEYIGVRCFRVGDRTSCSLKDNDAEEGIDACRVKGIVTWSPEMVTT